MESIHKNYKRKGKLSMTKEITVLEAINYAIEEGFEQANKQLTSKLVQESLLVIKSIHTSRQHF